MYTINKFGESGSKNQVNNAMLKLSLGRSLGITIHNNALNFHGKKITNLSAPSDPDDAVTKIFLKKKIDKIENKIKNQQDEILRRFEELQNKLKEDIHIEKIKEYIFKWVEVEKIVLENKKHIEAINSDLTKLKSVIDQFNNNLSTNLNILKNHNIEDTKKIIEDTLKIINIRFDSIEDFLFQSIGYTRKNKYFN